MYMIVAYREIVENNNIEWREANFETDPEVGVYSVHDYQYSRHIPFTSLAAAKQKVEELKAQYAEDFLNGNQQGSV